MPLFLGLAGVGAGLYYAKENGYLDSLLGAPPTGVQSAGGGGAFRPDYAAVRKAIEDLMENEGAVCGGEGGSGGGGGGGDVVVGVLVSPPPCPPPTPSTAPPTHPTPIPSHTHSGGRVRRRLLRPAAGAPGLAHLGHL